MQVIDLNTDSAERFLATQPVTIILYFTPGDDQVVELVNEFKSVAGTFSTNIGFGLVDLTATENQQLIREAVIVMTPTLIGYRFGKPCWEEVGRKAITKLLDRDTIIHHFGHTPTSSLKLL